MKIGILRSGLMGKETARDLVTIERVTAVGLADIDIDIAQKVVDQSNSPKLTAYQVNAKDEQELANYMRQFDVVINALFYTFNEIVAKPAFKVGVNSVDSGGIVVDITDKVLEWKEEAKAGAVT